MNHNVYRDSRLLAFVCAATQGLLAETEIDDERMTALQEICQSQADEGIATNIAYAAFQIAEALNRQWESRYGQEDSN